jgi:hypothetical protein
MDGLVMKALARDENYLFDSPRLLLAEEVQYYKLRKKAVQ